MFDNRYIIGAIALFALIGVAIWRKHVWGFWSAFWNRTAELAPDVSRQKLVAIISIVGGVVAVIATYFWLRNHDDASAEPTSQFVIAIAWLVVAILQILIPSDPEWEIIHAKRAKHEQGLLQQVLDRLRAERLNFEQIKSRKGRYNSNAHRKAVEFKSFELLLPEIKALRSIPKFRRRADAIAIEVGRNQSLDEKDVGKLIAQLNELEPQLQKEIERLGSIHRGLT
jgi:hypothetical protein